jgi:hypothetical protein
MTRANAVAVFAGALGIAIAVQAPAATAVQGPPQAVSYISGGMGYAEAAALKEEGRSFPLNLIFTAGKESAYLGNVKVTITDSGGRRLVDTVSDGPVMLVRLPTGTYRISAVSRGRAMQQTVHVDARGFRRVDFHWRDA